MTEELPTLGRIGPTAWSSGAPSHGRLHMLPTACPKAPRGNGRRWSDVGYHFLVDGGGHIYQGRRYEEAKPLEALPKLALGAHVKRQNSGKIGICMLGCYHPPANHCDDPLSERSLQAVMRLSAFLCQAYDVPPARIYGHRDFLRTACPGDVLFRNLARLRSGAIRAIESGA